MPNESDWRPDFAGLIALRDGIDANLLDTIAKSGERRESMNGFGSATLRRIAVLQRAASPTAQQGEFLGYKCMRCNSYRKNHKANGDCPYGGGKYATKELPDGKTCADCLRLKTCTGTFGEISENTSCYWFPIRFVAKEKE